MKHYLILPLLALFACNAPAQIGKTAAPVASVQAVSSPAPVASNAVGHTDAAAARPSFVTWDKKLVDLGPVKKGEKRTLAFELTNTSGQPFKIDLVDACACTTTDYPRGTIAPGGKARIDAIFDSTEKNESETIDIRVIFDQNDEAGNPRVEVVQYSFELIK